MRANHEVGQDTPWLHGGIRCASTLSICPICLSCHDPCILAERPICCDACSHEHSVDCGDRNAGRGDQFRIDMGASGQIIGDVVCVENSGKCLTTCRGAIQDRPEDVCIQGEAHCILHYVVSQASRFADVRTSTIRRKTFRGLYRRDPGFQRMPHRAKSAEELPSCGTSSLASRVLRLRSAQCSYPPYHYQDRRIPEMRRAVAGERASVPFPVRSLWLQPYQTRGYHRRGGAAPL